MALKVCVLASGSAANSIYLASGRTQILVDAGLSGREIARRLALIGVDPDALQAICVTHEHDDHTAGLGVLHRRHKTPLYANAATIEALERLDRLRGLIWQVFTTGSPFRINELTIEPFSVPHDAYDPVGFVVSDDGASIGIVTDVGTPTSLMRERLRQCQAVIIESNHDERMLREADRPWALKQRIASRQGHLSNDKAADMLKEIANAGTQTVFLAHISAECNRPETALHGVRKALTQAGHAHVKVLLTYPDRISEVVVVDGICQPAPSARFAPTVGSGVQTWR